MPAIICQNCTHENQLSHTYWDYKGIVKCEKCGVIMSMHMQTGSLISLLIKGPEFVKINNLPLGIQNDVNEAQICHNVGAYKSCVVMCRRALEQVCDDKGAKGGNLNNKIKNLHVTGLINPELADAFNVIRYFGNYGAHPKDDLLSGIDVSSAQNVLEVTIHVAQLVYEMPAKVKKLEQIKNKA